MLWEAILSIRDERDQLKAENARLAAERDAEAGKVAQMRAALDTLVKYADKTFEYWDGDEDMKVGKRLMWMAGSLPGYEPDKAPHAALAIPVSEAERKAGA